MVLFLEGGGRWEEYTKTHRERERERERERRLRRKEEKMFFFIFIFCGSLSVMEESGSLADTPGSSRLRWAAAPPWAWLAAYSRAQVCCTRVFISLFSAADFFQYSADSRAGRYRASRTLARYTHSHHQSLSVSVCVCVCV